MTTPPGLTDADRADLHERLASWFGDDRQAFLVSHLAPVIDRIKVDGYIAGVAAGVEVRASEFQETTLEMARKADAAERRAEDTEAAFEQLRSAADKVGHQAVCPVDPCGCWVRDLAPLLDGGSDGGVCPDCAGEWGKPMREGCKRPWHHADEWQWEQVAETTQGSGDDAWAVSVFQERGCDHQWLDRPESDTRECLICGTEVAG